MMLSEQKKDALRKKAYNTAISIMDPLAAIVARTSRVPTTPFLRAEELPWTKPLQDGWRDIRRELDRVMVLRDDLPAFHEINGDATTIRNDRWKTFFFYGFGRRSEINCRRCPQTTALIESVPGMMTAFFSILGPRVKLPLHRGPWKGFLRYHLGLIVPAPADQCVIEVGGQRAQWREGEGMVFDDTYEHRVWNDTDGTRVVLFLDVARPCRFPGSLVNQAVIRVAALTPFIQDSMRRHREWERRFSLLHGT
ncbi:MAG TPA: aspartyl/asparaginyl beta-hydroxylase domain-containing protein [Polyangia bacterium]|jgi:beta-hydroxylase|nr:aspartyl/asparaginyl beta-hydroxylase domain-containing protein [Polyangia bacterium]